MVNFLVSNTLLASHNLTCDEFTKMCVYAEKEIEKKGYRQDSSYRKKAESDFARDILIDYQKKRFTICSKKMGPIFFDNGLVKKVSAGLEVHTSGAAKAGKVKEVARLVNKELHEITRREIDFEERFGEVRSLARYTGKKGTPKTTYTQRLYSHDLFRLICAKIPYDIGKIIWAVGAVVETMHSQDSVHGDLKLWNILYSKKRIKVSDFGNSLRPKIDEPYTFFPGYGTTQYSAPEHLLQNQKNMLQEDLLQKKANDCFALGCILYTLLFKRNIPWAKDMQEGIQKADETSAKNADSTIRKERGKLLTRSSQPYYKLLMRLLDPLPKNRLTAGELMQKLDEDNRLMILAEVCCRKEARRNLVLIH